MYLIIQKTIYLCNLFRIKKLFTLKNSKITIEMEYFSILKINK